MSSSSRKSWTPQNERKEMEKEKGDAALAKIFDDPSFPFFFVGGTSGSCTGAAWHSSRFFRHEAPANVRVFLHGKFIYTIPQSAPYENDTYFFAGK